MPALTLDHLSIAWPDGDAVFTDLTGTFTHGRTGLVGRNGSGKSTLLRVLSGDLPATSGTIRTPGEVVYLPQSLTLDARRRVSDLLGVGDALRAVRAIEAGDCAPEHFDAVGDDWDIAARAEAALGRIGLDAGMLDRRVGELSGGEAILIAVSGLRLRGAAVTLLDEPTNNLDRTARGRLSDLLDDWPGVVVVVSHDRALLERMDVTAELYDGGLRFVDGGYSAWRAWLDAEQDAAVHAERDAAKVLRRERAQRIAAETVLAHRDRTARKAEREKRVPKIIAHGKRNAAQVSAAKLRGEKAGREEAARQARDEADRRIRSDDVVVVDAPDPQVAAGRRILTLCDGDRSWVLQGPERWALVGPNGSGKSTLLELLVNGTASPLLGAVGAEQHTDRVAMLRQRRDDLDGSITVWQTLRATAGDTDDRTLRNRLARLLLRGRMLDRRVSELSGGERFRVALARMVLADPAPQLLVLDEPTNDLDLDTARAVVETLRGYRGAVLVVSHDEHFLADLAPHRTLRLQGGRLHG